MACSMVQSPVLHGDQILCRNNAKLQVCPPSMRTFSASHSALQSSFFGSGSVSPVKSLRPIRKQVRSVKVHALFARCSEDAFKAFMFARDEYWRLKHEFFDTEHILLGLIGGETEIASKVLNSMNINLKDAQTEVEKILGKGSGPGKLEIRFSRGAKRILELSLVEASLLGHDDVNSEHLLLALLRVQEGSAVRILETLGADFGEIRTKVLTLLGHPSGNPN